VAALAGGGGTINVHSVSCSAPGDCVIGGDASSQDDNYGETQDGWVATETSGRWTSLVPVTIGWSGWPGRYITVNSVSCASPGNCAAVGYDSEEIEPEGTVDTYGAYVIDEVNGTGGTATPISGFAASGGSVTALSCTAPGDCGAGGWAYAGKQGTERVPFISDQVNGAWSSAEVPGYSALSQATVNAGPEVSAITCTAPGDCAAGGGFRTSGGLGGAFTISESAGTWWPAQRVPSIPLRVVHSSSEPYGIAVTGISCPAAGDCSPVIDDGVAYASYVMDEADGIWGTARLILGTTQSFLVSAVSCPAAGACLASGNEVAPGNEAGSLEWVLAKSVAASSLTAVSLAKKTVSYGDEEAEKVTARSARPVPPRPARSPSPPAAKATASCSLSPKRLKPGSYHLVAKYRGDSNFNGSSSGAKSLTITS
jgi:hypothetical protein